MQLNYVKSRFVIRNTSKAAIKIMGKVTANPNQTYDLFEAIPGLSEISIIDALRQPDGDLYLKQKNGQIDILEHDLVIFNNSQVKAVVEVLSAPAPELSFQYPLYKEGDSVSAQVASEFNDGIVKKEDFVEMRRSSLKVLVWQYQDFDLDGNVVTISQFNNFDFNDKDIVSGSAVIVDAQNPQKSINLGGGWFSPKVNLGIQSHVGATIVLTEKVSKKARVYFLVSILPHQLNPSMDLPMVPNIVRAARVELMLSRQVDNEKQILVLGEKTFANKVTFNDSVDIASDLKVSGTASIGSFFMKDGAGAGAVLRSNSLGQGAWGSVPDISDHPPNNPIPGHLWYSTVLNDVFYFHDKLSSFVSLGSESVDFISSKSRVDNAYLDVVCGGYANQPSYVSSDSFYISDIDFELESQAMMALELHSDAGIVSDNRFVINGGRRHSFKNLCIPVKAGIPLRFYINGTNIINPKVRVKIKKIA